MNLNHTHELKSREKKRNLEIMLDLFLSIFFFNTYQSCSHVYVHCIVYFLINVAVVVGKSSGLHV